MYHLHAEAEPRPGRGGVLLTPLNLEDGIECIPARDRRVLSLKYLNPEPHFARIRNLGQRSVVGMVSISPAALRTAGGLLHAAAGERHSVHQFLMEWPVGANGPRFRSFEMQDYQPPAHLRDFDEKSQGLRHEASVSSRNTSNVSERNMPKGDADVRVLSADDLKFIDLLFCDTIAHGWVKHRNCVKAQLLSDESLREIVAVAQRLVGFKKTAKAAGGGG
jgi:hypothetical protein